VGTITKALNLLNYFSVTQPEIGLSEFRKLTGQDKATIYRHLCELESNGFLGQDRQTRLYHLGPAILRLANVREKTFPARDAVAPIVDAISDALGELVHVSVLQGTCLSPLYHADIHIRGTRVYFDEGEMLPLHATASGLAMLAFAPTALLEEVITAPIQKFTENTILDPNTLRMAVEETRKRRFSISDESFEREVCSMATPIFDKDQCAFGTLAVALPAGRATDEKRAAIVAALIKGGEDVSQAFGGALPVNFNEERV